MATQSVKARRPFPYQGRRIAAGDVVHNVPTRDARSLIQRGLASAYVVEPTATPSAVSAAATVDAPRVLAGDAIAMARDKQQRGIDGLVTHGDETTTHRDPDALSDDDRARAARGVPSRGATRDAPASGPTGAARRCLRLAV